MQFAPITAASSSPAGAHEARDVVSPSKLFSIATTRFDAALRVLGQDDSQHVPSALATSIAAREAQSGIGALQSVLIPSTPWGPRQIAATAMRTAELALTSLRHFSAQMAPRGEGPFHRPDLAAAVLLSLDVARAKLRTAIRGIAPHAK